MCYHEYMPLTRQLMSGLEASTHTLMSLMMTVMPLAGIRLSWLSARGVWLPCRQKLAALKLYGNFLPE
jgi:hypothetical protein